MITLCLPMNGSNSVALSTPLGFIHKLKMSGPGLSAIITCFDVMYTLCLGWEERRNWAEEERSNGKSPCFFHSSNSFKLKSNSFKV